MYLYLKAFHIIFIVTWFAGLFYMPRLFVYLAEAQLKETTEKDILTKQFLLMSKRLWLGITWPSAVITLVLGISLWYQFAATPSWLLLKLCFVVGLYLYHISMHIIYVKHSRMKFPFTSQQMRLYNEVSTIFLVAIVMLVVVRENISLLYGLGGLTALIIMLLLAIRIYKNMRKA